MLSGWLALCFLVLKLRVQSECLIPPKQKQANIHAVHV